MRHRQGFPTSDASATNAGADSASYKGYHSETRTKVAQTYYPKQSAKVAGFILSGIINDKRYSLHSQLKAVGYVRGKRSYSDVMVALIDRFMRQHKELLDIRNVLQYVRSEDRDEMNQK